MPQILILFLTFLTGAAGLTYQVLWQKYLALFLGSDALAISAMLTTFFCCLAAGYLIMGFALRRTRANRIKIYCYLELSIGIYGALSPLIFEVLVSTFPPVQSNFLSNLVFTFLFMGLPTLLMGGTIPTLTDGLSRTFEVSHRVHSWVYGSNTLGAFIGAIFCGFYLIEFAGLKNALYLTSCLNLLVFAIGIWVAGFYEEINVRDAPLAVQESARRPRAKYWLLAISFLSGFYTFSFENLLVRATGLSMGSSNYSYTLIVSAFIAALAMGSFVASRFSNEKSPSTLFYSQIAGTALMIAVFLSIPSWPNWIYSIKANLHPSLSSYPLFLFLTFTLLFAALALPIGTLGMNLPLVFDSAKQRSILLGETVGKVYFVNCIGCALGAAFGGNILFHFLGTEDIFRLTLILLAGTIPICSLIVDTKTFKGAGVTIFALFSGIIFILPPWSPKSFIPSRPDFPKPAQEERSALEHARNIVNRYDSRLIFSKSDPLAEVHVDQVGSFRNLWINATNNSNTGIDSSTRALAALTPISLAPTIEKVFVIGLGAGLSTSILSGVPEVQSVEVAELSESVIQALPHFDEQNIHLKLNRGKVQIHLGDAYQILRANKRTYDLVVAEPSQFWIQGVEKLYSKEFIEAVSKKISPTGIHAQWFPLSPMTQTTFLKIIKSFQSVYPFVTLWHAPNAMVFTVISSKTPLQMQVGRLKDRFRDLGPQLAAARVPSPQALSLLQAAPESLVKSLSEVQGEIYHNLKPQLSYESERGRYIGISFDLDDFLERNFFKLNGLSESNSDLVRQRSFVPLTEADYSAFIDTSFKTDLLGICANRIMWEASTQFPRRFGSLIKQDSKSIYEFVLGTSDVRPRFSSDDDLHRVIRLYRKASMMNLKVVPKRFFELFPKICASTACSDAKHSAIVSLNLLEANLWPKKAEARDSNFGPKVDEAFQLAAAKLFR